MKITWETKSASTPRMRQDAAFHFSGQDGKFIITEGGATESKIREVVSKCPSGALQIRN
jgi:uncharacterized Fe-S cluster protein YjdI